MEKELKVLYRDCQIVEKYKNRIVVKLPKVDGEKHSQRLVAKFGEKLEVGDNVCIARCSFLPKWAEILIYLSPIAYLLAGFGFGFFFHSNLYHFLLTLGTTVVGFGGLVIAIWLLSKKPRTDFVARKTFEVTKESKKKKKETIEGGIENVEEKILEAVIAVEPVINQVADDVVEVISEIV